MWWAFEPIWPWWWILLSGIVIALLTMWAYRCETSTLGQQKRVILALLRLLTVLSFLLLVVRPTVFFGDQEAQRSTLMVLLDSSRSMSLQDAPGGKTRFSAALEDFRSSLHGEGQDHQSVEVRLWSFAEDLKPWDETLVEPQGSQTALGYALKQALVEARHYPLAGVLILSDGAQRALPPHDDEPLASARLWADAQIPIYTVGYGSMATNQGLDLSIQNLLVNSVVFEKKLVPVKFQLRTQGARGRKARVRLMIEDRSQIQVGTSGPLVPITATSGTIPQREIQIEEDQTNSSLELTFIPEIPGEYKLGVEVESLDGEIRLDNNQAFSLITVQQGGVKVAYIDQPRPEQRWVRMLNGEEAIQLDYYEVRGSRFQAPQRLNADLSLPGKYDVYILGDVSATTLGQRQLQLLAQRVQEGAGFLMTGGLENFGSGGYAQTPLADFIPVILSSTNIRKLPTDNTEQLTGPQQFLPTALGLKRYVMQLTTDGDNRERWRQLPPLEGAVRLQPKHELIEVWAETESGHPLLLAAEVGKARVAALAADTTYIWALSGFSDDHQRFWRQLILWLARKEDQQHQGVWVKVEPRVAPPGTKIGITGGYEAADTSPPSRYDVEVTLPTGDRVPLTPIGTPQGFTTTFHGSQQPGDYWLRAYAKQGNQVLGFGAMTRFMIEDRDIELDHPLPDWDTLRQMAELTGGQMLTPEELPNLLKRLQNIRQNRRNQSRGVTVSQHPLFLILVVSLLTVEWVLRKKWGLA